MSFSDLFDSEFKQRNKGHFSAIVRVALADDTFTQKRNYFRQTGCLIGNFSSRI
jgi:hypothetical protein